MNQALPIAYKQRTLLRLAASSILLVSLMVVIIFSVYAADAGDLDPDFDGDGIATINFGDVGDYGYDMALQTDGRVIIVGKSFNGANDDFALTRLNADGTLDTTFGTGGTGKVLTDFGSSNDVANAVAIMNDGKIVVAGSSTVGGTSDFAVARYNPDGTLDTTFDTDGKVTTDIATKIDYANDVAIDGSGRIVAFGYYQNNIYDDGAIVRYNDNGSLDGGFAAGGIYKTSAQWGEFKAGVIDGGGKILAMSGGFSVWRFNADGSPDTGFDGDGRANGNPTPFNDYSNDIAIYPGGKIVVAGWSNCCNDNVVSVIRMNSDGSMDNSFDADGVAGAIFAGGDVNIYALAVDTSGRIIVGGDFQPGGTGSDFDFALARFNPNGTLDTSFSFDGKLTTSLGAGEDRINGLAVTTNDRIIVAGQTINGIDNNFAAAQYYAVQVIPTSTPTGTPTETPTGTLTEVPTSTPTSEPFTELLTNNSFEVDADNNKIPDGWTGKNLTGDKLVKDKPEKGKFFAYDGEKAFRFKSSLTKNSKLVQKVSASFLTTAGVGDSIQLSAWLKPSVPITKAVMAKIKYTNNNKLKLQLDIPEESVTNEYQQFSKVDSLSGSIASIKVIIKYQLKRKHSPMLVDLVELRLFENSALDSSLLPLP